MKTYLLLLTAICFSVALAAQPPEFDFNSGCSTDFGNLYAQLTLDGQPLADGTWVAAVDPEGNIAGRAQVTTIGSFAGLIILPVYEDLDSPNACIPIDGGIDCDLPDGCEQFGVITYIENPTNPSLNCFAATVAFIDYVKVSGPGGEQEIEGFTSNDVVAGIATVIALSSTMPPCYLDYNDAFTVLPIELTSFTGRQSGKSVVLDWATASEDGNDYFSIERSADGVEFVSLGEVAGAGTSREAQVYSFNDDSPLEGQNYYRLRQNDFTGTFSYSDVVVVSFDGGNQTFLEVSPNPATDFLRVKISGDWEDVARVVLMDMNGKVISDQRQPTASTINMELNHLPAGIYQLQVTDGKHKESQRVIVR